MSHMLKPYYNPKFQQWELSWKSANGSYGAVWGDTEEECMKRYKESFKKEKK